MRQGQQQALVVEVEVEVEEGLERVWNWRKEKSRSFSSFWRVWESFLLFLLVRLLFPRPLL